VIGENIAQAFQFVASGNAELGFVALSQLREPGNTASGSSWVVPQALYAPIRQDAVLLARGSGNAAARQFLEFLRSDASRVVIRGFGYGLP
jgi:molybdate transport system substrate-binding protein